MKVFVLDETDDRGRVYKKPPKTVRPDGKVFSYIGICGFVCSERKLPTYRRFLRGLEDFPYKRFRAAAYKKSYGERAVPNGTDEQSKHLLMNHHLSPRPVAFDGRESPKMVQRGVLRTGLTCFFRVAIYPPPQPAARGATIPEPNRRADMQSSRIAVTQHVVDEDNGKGAGEWGMGKRKEAARAAGHDRGTHHCPCKSGGSIDEGLLRDASNGTRWVRCACERGEGRARRARDGCRGGDWRRGGEKAAGTGMAEAADVDAGRRLTGEEACRRQRVTSAGGRAGRGGAGERWAGGCGHDVGGERGGRGVARLASAVEATGCGGEADWRREYEAEAAGERTRRAWEPGAAGRGQRRRVGAVEGWVWCARRRLGASCGRDGPGWGAGAAQQCGGGCQVGAVDAELGTQRGAQRGGRSPEEKGGAVRAARVRCWGGAEVRWVWVVDVEVGAAGVRWSSWSFGKATWCVDGGLDASALFGRFVPSAAPGVPRWGAGCGGWGGGEQRLF
ncbi:hypothetical protein B0H13DRAFT_2487335 [Mycena leptocephala]|nr:hypothetical protein B0H13DRAFT_2487335 [Mycena leptocephala]